MKKILIFLLFFMPSLSMAQSEWEKPMTAAEKLELAKKAEAESKKAKKEAQKALKEERKRIKKLKKSGVEISEADKAKAEKIFTQEPKSSKDKEYLKKDAVPEINGNVVFTLDIDVPGKTAQDIYDKVYTFLDKMSQEPNQIKSGIAIYNKKEYIVAAKYSEWLDFTKSFFILDRTEFNYTIIAKCQDGHLNMTLERISYNYEEGRENGFKASAETLISDKYAVNKKGTKLVPGSAKFRRKTIDRKNQIFDAVKGIIL